MTLLCVSCRFFQVVHTTVVRNDRCPGYVPQSQLINKVVCTPVVAQSLIPMAYLFSRPWRFPCCRTHGGRCPCCVGRASSALPLVRRQSRSHSCSCREPRRMASTPGRGAEAVSHGLADHRNSPVPLRQGDRRPCCAGRASSTCRGGGDSRPPVC